MANLKLTSIKRKCLQIKYNIKIEEIKKEIIPAKKLLVIKNNKNPIKFAKFVKQHTVRKLKEIFKNDFLERIKKHIKSGRSMVKTKYL